jgi:putative transposase
MHDWESFSHVRWECKYHVVIIPKYRRKTIYGQTEGEGRQDPARAVRPERNRTDRKKCAKGPCAHVPQHSAEVQRRAPDRIPEGKSAVRIHRELLHERRMTGLHFWSTGYCVTNNGTATGANPVLGFNFAARPRNRTFLTS